MKIFSFVHFLGGWTGGKICTRWIGLHVITKKMKLYYLHVVKNPYLQDVSYRPDKFKCLYIWISLIWEPQNWYEKPTVDGCMCKKYEPGGAMKQWHCCTVAKHSYMRVKTQDSKRYDSHQWTDSPFTQEISFCFFYCFWSVSILSDCPISICSCHELMQLSLIGPIAYRPHTRFHFCKFLTYLCYNYGSFSNITGMELGVGGCSKLFNLCPN
jgi:hypothetical protein